MIETSISLRTTRSTALELGEEYGIRPFFALYLTRLDRRTAIELMERASFLYPTDTERRGERVRDLCLAATS